MGVLRGKIARLSAVDKLYPLRQKRGIGAILAILEGIKITAQLGAVMAFSARSAI